MELCQGRVRGGIRESLFVRRQWAWNRLLRAAVMAPSHWSCGQCSQAYVLIFERSCVEPGVGLNDPVGSFQYRIFYEKLNLVPNFSSYFIGELCELCEKTQTWQCSLPRTASPKLYATRHIRRLQKCVFPSLNLKILKSLKLKILLWT